MLIECLNSIAKIGTPTGAEVLVTVVDNDQFRSMEPVVVGMRDSFPFPLFYHCEKKRGIPCARNRSIDETLVLDCQYLVFIDDDEWVERDWLSQLYCYGKSRGEVIVSGSVISELPDGTPDHIYGLFNTRQRKTGVRLSSCATNNVLIPVSIIKQHHLRFDETDPLAGGTDTIFFCGAVKAGVDIFKCAEAKVHETVPKSRIALKWLAKRKYRVGITAAWRKQQEGRSKINIAGSSIFQIFSEFCKAGTFMLLGKKVERNESLLKACRSAGILSGIFGKKVDSYKKIDN